MKSFVASLFLASLLSSCASGPTVSTDHDPAVTFSSYHTYAWLKQPEGINPLAEQRIVAGVESRLAAKGWTQAASPEQADVAIAANVASHQEQSLDTMYTGMGMASSTTRVTTYTVGTLVLDMFDTKTKRAIWRGTASGTVSEKPEQNTANIEAALNKMFTNFPPGSAPAAK